MSHPDLASNVKPYNESKDNTVFIPGNTMVENVRALAWSALPDAPVEPDDRRGSTRAVVAAMRRLLPDAYATTRRVPDD